MGDEIESLVSLMPVDCIHPIFSLRCQATTNRERRNTNRGGDINGGAVCCLFGPAWLNRSRGRRHLSARKMGAKQCAVLNLSTSSKHCCIFRYLPTQGTQPAGT